jgi:hypothetical protein
MEQWYSDCKGSKFCSEPSSSTSRSPSIDLPLRRSGPNLPLENIYWPHLWVCGLCRGGIGGCCRYPTDRVPPHTSFKSRQGAGHASTRCDLPDSSRPHLTIEVDSGGVTCPAAPDLASLLRGAPALPRVPQLWTLPPMALGFASLRGELWCCHMSHDPSGLWTT